MSDIAYPITDVGFTPEGFEDFKMQVSENLRILFEEKVGIREGADTDLYGPLFGTADQITVTRNADSTVTFSTPQDIDTGAIPVFGGLSIAGNIGVTGTVDGVDLSDLVSGAESFSAISLDDDATIGCAGGPILTFDDTLDYLTLTANDKLVLLGGSDVSLTANTGDFIIGAIAGQHLTFDANEIESKSNGTTAGTLHLQNDGGILALGSATACSIQIGAGKTVWVAPGTNTLSAAAAAASSGDCLMLMAGTYNQSEVIQIDGKALSIIGMGPEVSEIICSATHGIDVLNDQVGENALYVTFKDFSLFTVDAGTYYAIELEFYAASSGRRAFIENLSIGADVATDYWERSINIKNAKGAEIIGCTFTGCSTNLGDGIYIEGLSQEMTISDCMFYRMDHTIKCVDSADNEGLYIDHCQMVAVNYGVHWVDTRTRPLLSVTDCHINCIKGGIYTDYIGQVYLAGNNIIRLSTSTEDPLTLITIKNNTSNTIVGNYLSGETFEGDPARDSFEINGIVLVSAGNSFIIGNGIWVCDVDINLDAGTTATVVHSNNGNGTTHIVNNGGVTNRIIEVLNAGHRFYGNLEIPDGATIGTVTTPAAITIDGDGVVTTSGTLTAANLGAVGAITGVGLAISDYAYIDALTVGSDVDPGANNLVVDGSVGIGTAPGYALHVEKSVADFVAAIVNTHDTDGDGLLLQAGDSAAEYILLLRDDAAAQQFKFMADGNAYSKTGWNDFSPQINIENPTPSNYLDWALEDAEKPVLINKEIPEGQTDIEKYGKNIGKMARGTTLWAKEAREQIQSLTIEIEQLRQILKDNNLITDN